MNLSTQLAFRPRHSNAPTSSTAMNTSLAPPYQLPNSSEASAEDLLDDLRGQIFVQLSVMGVWAPSIHTDCVVEFYYTCVLDGNGKLAYSSLAQNSAEESLRSVLELVRGDAETMRGEREVSGEDMDDETEDDDDENEGKEEDDDYEENENDDYVDAEMDMD